MNPDKSLYKDDTKFEKITVKGGKDSYGRGERGVKVAKGFYYLDTYTSIDILYEKKRPGIPRRIKSKKLPIVTEVEEIL